MLGSTHDAEQRLYVTFPCKNQGRRIVVFFWRQIDEQDFWSREETSAVALALVLYNDAQDVWQRSDASEATDARARARVGRHRDGGRAGQKTSRVAAVYSVG